MFFLTRNALKRLVAACSVAISAQMAAGVSRPPELHVSGNQLVTITNQPVWLQGLCVDSLEWSAQGENLPQSIPVAIKQWHANVIRLPINSDFWWGGKNHDVDSANAYRTLIDTCIETAGSRGAYVALDLHRFGLPSEEDVAFWKDASGRYKDDSAVIFELFNEPHDISWHAWRFGGTVDNRNHGDTNVAENKQAAGRRNTVGMQALVDAVRSAGSKNLLICGGIDWGYDLSGLLHGYALDDRGGNGIMYSSHIYPWKHNWQHNTLDAAARFPVFVGEVGCPRRWQDFDFIPKEARGENLGPGSTWANDVIAMFQKYRLNWTGFSFHPSCGPPIISDWNYTPTDYWGVYVKRALVGEQFTMKGRLR